ncbi:MAG: hypothetical protein AAF847_13815 [Bacteroidota bacterium]
MNTEKNNITEWLEQLQQESWNLELLISGFSIFLLAQAKNKLLELVDYVDLFYSFEHDVRNVIMLFLGITILSCYALIISLIFHILLRGFWIGTIGLRSVQPKVDFKRLRYAPAFEQYLNNKLPTLDKLLIRLDQVSSAVFSFAFLIIFMLISLAAWFLFYSIISGLFSAFVDLFPEESTISNILVITLEIVLLIFILVSLLYLIDTLSTGLLKKIKQRHISKVYRGLYRMMNAVTLSFLYRSIHYHLISYFGIWPSRILISVFIFSMVLTPYLRLSHAIYYPDYPKSSGIETEYYDDMRTPDEAIWRASIPSTTIKDNSLPLFIRYSPDSNPTLAHLCADYEPAKQQRIMSGINLDGGLNINDPYFQESSPDSLLACLTSIYEVRLNDSLLEDLKYYYLTHPNKEELGIYTVLDIEHLEKGNHLLNIKYKDWQESQDTVLTRNWANVTFWKANPAVNE